MTDSVVLVVDAGTASLKAGYAGEDAPATIIPSVAQKCANGLEVWLVGQEILLDTFIPGSRRNPCRHK